nr:uncharacterized protein LOC105848640 isoform X3 [Hydra vulgaris]XP_047131923.1 uncharacterized protein LOC105848640 isoform X3 [Hydra vulgaris]
MIMYTQMHLVMCNCKFPNTCKIVGDMAHVLKSSVTVDSARMKTLIHFYVMEYTRWQFLAHCYPNTGIRNPYLYVTDAGDEVIIMCGKRLFYEVFHFLTS